MYDSVYQMNFKQYVSHQDEAVGYFDQKIEFGFVDFDLPTVLITSGYMTSDNISGYTMDENELAYLLGYNYLYVEHRYFGSSLPCEIDYDDNDTWKYLTTEEAAGDYHEILTQFKRILDGKWVATGISKGGMTTELYAYYYPGEMDLYLPYVAPFCSSYSDTRAFEFIYNEAGDVKYGEEKAAQIRDNLLAFQIKMIEWEDVLSDRFYDDGLDDGAVYSEYTTKENLYEAALLEFSFCFWQYDQPHYYLPHLLSMSEETEAELEEKQDEFYDLLTSEVTAIDLAVNNEYTPYFIQAYQELGNYRYDLSYLRNALPEGLTLSVPQEEDEDLMWRLTLTETQLDLKQYEPACAKINAMLATTDDNFIIIYGATDPYYSMRPDDVERDNVKIYVSLQYPHTISIGRFSADVKEEILSYIQSVLGV